MSRAATLLTILAAVLVVVLFFIFGIRPIQNDISETRQQTEDVIAQQQTTRTQIERLRNVRSTAPEIEAELAAADTIIPRTADLPAAVRQLQVAADDSGGELVTVSVTRPENVDVEGAPDELVRLNLSVTYNGGYFQVVDFLRRIEDPAISPRAFVWGTMNVAEEEDGSYPLLTATVTGSIFALLPPGSVESAVDTPTEEGTEPAEDASPDAENTTPAEEVVS